MVSEPLFCQAIVPGIFDWHRWFATSRVLKKGLIAVFNGQITVGDVPWESLG